MDRLEVFHVADVDVDAADIIHGAAGGFDRGFKIFADLAGLSFDVADTGNRPVCPSRSHSGNEDQTASGLHHCCLGEMAAWLPNPVAADLLLRHETSCSMWVNLQARYAPSLDRVHRGSHLA